MTEEIEVYTKKQLLGLAEEAAEFYDSTLDSQFSVFEQNIKEKLHYIAAVGELTENDKIELGELYDAWESEGFPLPDEEDVETEGGPEDEE